MIPITAAANLIDMPKDIIIYLQCVLFIIKPVKKYMI